MLGAFLGSSPRFGGFSWGWPRCSRGLPEELLVLSLETCSWASGVSDGFVLSGGESLETILSVVLKNGCTFFDHPSIKDGVFVPFPGGLGRLMTTSTSSKWQK